MNPLATITALAERSVSLVLHKNSWEVNLITKNGRLDLFGEPKHSFLLTPDMQARQLSHHTLWVVVCDSPRSWDGHIHIGADIEDFAVAENVAKGASSSARFYLSVDTYSMENHMFIYDLSPNYSDVQVSD